MSFLFQNGMSCKLKVDHTNESKIKSIIINAF